MAGWLKKVAVNRVIIIAITDKRIMVRIRISFFG
jgi:hypothetical protein